MKPTGNKDYSVFTRDMLKLPELHEEQGKMCIVYSKELPSESKPLKDVEFYLWSQGDAAHTRDAMNTLPEDAVLLGIISHGYEQFVLSIVVPQTKKVPASTMIH